MSEYIAFLFCTFLLGWVAGCVTGYYLALVKLLHDFHFGP